MNSTSKKSIKKTFENLMCKTKLASRAFQQNHEKMGQ